MSGDGAFPVRTGKLRVASREIDFDAQLLRDPDGRPIELRPQVWAVLTHLASRAGKLVTKEDLLAAVWPGLVVTDASITQAIRHVREALGEAGHQAIRTVPRRGYMLVADPPTRQDEPEGDDRSSVIEAREAEWQSIAVLPFADIEPTQADRGLARGFAQELLMELARNADLRVVSHLSSFVFAGTDTSLAEIGKRLRCRNLVDGRVRRDGENVRIGVELIDAESGDIVWAEDHRIGVAQLASLRDDLVQQIAGSLYYKSGEPPPLRLSSSPPPKSLDVYALTNHALALWFKRSPEAIREAKSLLERVITIDPEYARGWAMLAIVNNGEAHMRLTGDREPGVAQECMAQARRAVELDPQSPIAYRALSLAYLLVLDYATALKFAQRTVELAPSAGEALHVLSIVQLRLGLLQPALRSIEAAMDRLPVPPGWVLHQYGFILWANGRLIEALQAADECLAKMPTYRWGHALRMYALVELGRLEEARREAALVLQQAPWLTTKRLTRFAESAVALEERMLAASIAAGIPER